MVYGVVLPTLHVSATKIWMFFLEFSRCRAPRIDAAYSSCRTVGPWRALRQRCTWETRNSALGDLEDWQTWSYGSLIYSLTISNDGLAGLRPHPRVDRYQRCFQPNQPKNTTNGSSQSFSMHPTIEKSKCIEQLWASLSMRHAPNSQFWLWF